MTTFGSISELIPKNESIFAYQERIVFFLAVNSVTPEKAAAVLLNSVGSKVYGLLRSLVDLVSLFPTLSITNLIIHL